MPQQPPHTQLLLTLREFASILSPPMTEAQLRHLVTALGWQPAGYRHDGRGGHPRQTFGADDLRRAYAAVAPLLGPFLRVPAGSDSLPVSHSTP